MQAFERLDVYRVAVEFDQVMTAAMGHLRGPDCDQLDRATGSVLNNIAEAAVLPPGPNKARIFRLALSEAAECLALVARMERRGRISRPTFNHARSLISRTMRMLKKLSTVR